MGKRGPASRSQEERQNHTVRFRVFADNWSLFFYMLRDGAPGCVEKSEGESSNCIEVSMKELLEFGAVEREISVNPDGTLPRQTRRTVAIEVIPAKIPSENIPTELGSKNGWSVFPSLNPQPALWEKLKTAPNFAEHQQTSAAIQEWWETHARLFPFDPLFRAIITQTISLLGSRELFDAKRLWFYPRSDRPTSDNKRIEFFAKAMAELSLGKRPATASRDLTGAHFPSSKESQKPFADFIARRQSRIREKRDKRGL